MSSAPRPLTVLWRALTPALRRRMFVLQFVSVIMALSTMTALAAVMSFVAILADPLLIDAHAALRLLRTLAHRLQLDVGLIASAAFIALLVAGALVNLAGARAMGRFVHAVSDRIRAVLYAEYLRRDYLFHVRSSVMRLTDDVLYQADRLNATLLNALLFVTNALLTLFVVGSIAVVSPWVAVGGTVAVAASYLVLYRLARRGLRRHGHALSQLGAERAATVTHSFVGIKYLQMTRAQAAFESRLAAVSGRMSAALADTQFIAQFPRYLLECVAGTALIVCALVVSRGATDATWLAPLSFVGFAGFRLLPAAQQMYSAFVLVRAHRPAIDFLASELQRPSAEAVESPRGAAALRWRWSRSIELDAVSFRYSQESSWVLEQATLRVAAGAAVGIVGASGSGKTTLVDVLLGLLSPVRGRVAVDGETLDERRSPAWQLGVGYVPQDVFLLEGTLRANIAFGVAAAAIDDARVREAARRAGALEFIDAMPAGLDTIVSLTGHGLSGGQRQRIGIARALYREPSLLVLDEATNALDAATEAAIVETVIRNRGAATVIVIAHAGEVVAACDVVYELRQGGLQERPSAAARAALERA